MVAPFRVVRGPVPQVTLMQDFDILIVCRDLFTVRVQHVISRRILQRICFNSLPGQRRVSGLSVCFNFVVNLHLQIVRNFRYVVLERFQFGVINVLVALPPVSSKERASGVLDACQYVRGPYFCTVKPQIALFVWQSGLRDENLCFPSEALCNLSRGRCAHLLPCRSIPVIQLISVIPDITRMILSRVPCGRRVRSLRPGLYPVVDIPLQA